MDSSALSRLNEAIKKLKEVGLVEKQGDIAKDLGYNRAGTISEILNGKKPLNNKFLMAFCREYRINLDYIKNGVGEMFQNLGGPIDDPYGGWHYKSLTTINARIKENKHTLLHINNNNEKLDINNLKRIIELLEDKCDIFQQQISTLKDENKSLKRIMEELTKLSREIKNLNFRQEADKEMVLQLFQNFFELEEFDAFI